MKSNTLLKEKLAKERKVILRKLKNFKKKQDLNIETLSSSVISQTKMIDEQVNNKGEAIIQSGAIKIVSIINTKYKMTLGAIGREIGNFDTNFQVLKKDIALKSTYHYRNLNKILIIDLILLVFSAGANPIFNTTELGGATYAIYGVTFLVFLIVRFHLGHNSNQSIKEIKNAMENNELDAVNDKIAMLKKELDNIEVDFYQNSKKDNV